MYFPGRLTVSSNVPFSLVMANEPSSPFDEVAFTTAATRGSEVLLSMTVPVTLISIRG